MYLTADAPRPGTLQASLVQCSHSVRVSVAVSHFLYHVVSLSLCLYKLILVDHDHNFVASNVGIHLRNHVLSRPFSLKATTVLESVMHM